MGFDSEKLKEHYFEVRVELKEGVDGHVAEKMAKMIKDAVRDDIRVEEVYLSELTARTMPAGDDD